jgi:hypothetical protein
MEPERSYADGSEPAESQADISTLNLQQLRALLHEHEDSSRRALDNALGKKQSAERHYEITREREAQAQSYLRRYEEMKKPNVSLKSLERPSWTEARLSLRGGNMILALLEPKRSGTMLVYRCECNRSS